MRSLPASHPLAELAARAALDAALLRGRVWRADSLGASHSPVLASGHAALDAELPGGGWATGSINEILCAPQARLEWRLLAPALAPWLGGPRRKRLLLIGPPCVPGLNGLLNAGLPPSQLVWIAAATTQERLWATEQALKNPATAALMAWLPELQGAQAAQIRRLQTAAQGAEGVCFLMRPEAALQQSSAAPLRARLEPGEGFSLRVQLVKRRGPAHETPLTLPALPAGWERLLSPRVLAGIASRPLAQEPSHALARPAAVN
jgi:protein ImuA